MRLMEVLKGLLPFGQIFAAGVLRQKLIYLVMAGMGLCSCFLAFGFVRNAFA